MYNPPLLARVPAASLLLCFGSVGPGTSLCTCAVSRIEQQYIACRDRPRLSRARGRAPGAGAAEILIFKSATWYKSEPLFMGFVTIVDKNPGPVRRNEQWKGRLGARGSIIRQSGGGTLYWGPEGGSELAFRSWYEPMADPYTPCERGRDPRARIAQGGFVAVPQAEPLVRCQRRAGPASGLRMASL